MCLEQLKKEIDRKQFLSVGLSSDKREVATVPGVATIVCVPGSMPSALCVTTQFHPMTSICSIIVLILGMR
jgi:hypothetical protein